MDTEEKGFQDLQILFTTDWRRFFSSSVLVWEVFVSRTILELRKILFNLTEKLPVAEEENNYEF